ncbi:MAG: pyridoxal-phosphate dependent enzyme, partial [Alphaproteobacteria bacterium]|nr:pyridoxal-phosphate dependent enzyme [Alphaproteobacteria bacterium]
CRVPVDKSVALINRYAERIVTVSEAEIAAAMRYYFTDTHNVAEGAGAAALAALLQEREAVTRHTIGLVLSGGNVDRSVFQNILAEGD